MGGREGARSWGRCFRKTSWKPSESDVGYFGGVLFVVLFYVNAHSGFLPAIFALWTSHVVGVIWIDPKDVFRVRDKKMQM